MIVQYFISKWDFLVFIAGSAGMTVLLCGDILMFVGMRVGKITGQNLILRGIILEIVVVFFMFSLPDFVPP